jgi:hypothetical protein
MKHNLSDLQADSIEAAQATLKALDKMQDDLAEHLISCIDAYLASVPALQDVQYDAQGVRDLTSDMVSNAFHDTRQALQNQIDDEYDNAPMISTAAYYGAPPRI